MEKFENLDFTKIQHEHVSKLYKAINDTLLRGIQMELERRGYTFKNDDDLINFIQEKINIIREQKSGYPIYYKYITKLNNEEIFGIEINTDIKFHIDMKNNLSTLSPIIKISDLKGKLNKQTVEEIDVYIEKLRNEWKREMD